MPNRPRPSLSQPEQLQKFKNRRQANDRRPYARHTDNNAGQPAPSRNGGFIWYELMTPDAEGSKAFYDAVVGWESAPRSKSSKAIG